MKKYGSGIEHFLFWGLESGAKRAGRASLLFGIESELCGTWHLVRCVGMRPRTSSVGKSILHSKCDAGYLNCSMLRRLDSY